MTPLFHILITLPLCYILYPEIGIINTVFLFFGGWAFDVDHYLYCIFKHKNFSLRDCYNFHHPFAKEKDLLHIFHVIEFYLLILIIGIFIKPILWAFFGLFYHILFDIINICYYKINRNPHADNCRARSLFRWLKRHSPSNSTKLKTL